MTVSVSAVDAGQSVAAEHPIELDLNAVAVTIDTVSGDDLLNAAEKGGDLTLSGQTQGVEAGQTVVVKFADQTFTAQVQQDGSPEPDRTRQRHGKPDRRARAGERQRH